VAVYYRDLDNGPWVGYRERDAFFPASLAKVPIVLACLRRAEADPGFLSRRVVNAGSGDEKVPGFMNPEVNLERGASYTVQQLILRVAEYSDNAAAQLLAEAVGPKALAGVYADLGLGGRSGDGSGQMSPKEYGALFRILYNASYLDRARSELALEWFARSTFELGLVAGVPQDVVVSHKFGVWEGRGETAPLQLHDCGIVYHPGSPYLLCVMTAGGNYVRMTSAIAEVSRFVYRQVDGAALRPAPAAR
jgi:beta-lactamase class A